MLGMTRYSDELERVRDTQNKLFNKQTVQEFQKSHENYYSPKLVNIVSLWPVSPSPDMDANNHFTRINGIAVSLIDMKDKFVIFINFKVTLFVRFKGSRLRSFFKNCSISVHCKLVVTYIIL